MLTFKEMLCLLAIFIAYGITGKMDYEDALLLEEAQRPHQQYPCADPLEGPIAATSMVEASDRRLYHQAHLAAAQDHRPSDPQPCQRLAF